jgi:hypothetical protein
VMVLWRAACLARAASQPAVSVRRTIASACRLSRGPAARSVLPLPA